MTDPVDPEVPERPTLSASGTLAAGGTLRLLSAGVGIVGGLLVSVALVRELGVYEFGIYAFVISVVGLAGVLADAGVGNGISRMVAFLEGEEAKSWVRGSLRVSVTAGSVMTILVLLGVPLAPSATRVPLMIASPLVLLASLRSAEGGFFSATRRVLLLEGTSIGTQVAVYVSILGITLAGAASVELILAVQVVIRAAGVGILGVAWWQIDHAPSMATRPTHRTILAFSLPLMLSAVAGIVLQRSDVVLLGLLSGPAAAGEYAPVLRAFDIAPVIVSAIGYYFFSVGASLVRRKDFDRLRDAYVSVTKWEMVLTMPLLLTLLLLPVPVMTTLYGPTFSDTDTIARVLAVGFIVNVITGVNGGALVALGATRQIAIRSTVLIVTNIVLNIVLIPPFGALGAALATTIVTIALNAFNSLLIWRLARLHPLRSDTVAFFVAIVVAASASIAAVYALGLEASLAGSVVVFGCVLVAGGVAALVTLRPEERKLGTALLTRFRPE